MKPGDLLVSSRSSGSRDAGAGGKVRPSTLTGNALEVPPLGAEKSRAVDPVINKGSTCLSLRPLAALADRILDIYGLCAGPTETARRQITASQAEKASRTEAQRKIASALLRETRARQGQQRIRRARRSAAELTKPITTTPCVIIVSNTAASGGAIVASGGVAVDDIPQS